MEKELSDQAEMRQRLERRRQELMRQYNVTSMDAVPINFSGISLQEGEEHGNEVFDRHYGTDLRDLRRAEPRLPACRRRGADAADALAVDGAGRHRLRPPPRVRPRRRGVPARHPARHERTTSRGTRQTRSGLPPASRDLWAKVPEFTYELPGAGWVLEQNWSSVLLLLAWCAGSIWFATRAALRVVVD